MDWISTRGHGPVDWATALREGPAPDGGLYLPERTEPRLGGPPGAELHHTATWLLGPWLEGAAPEAEVARVAREAFAAPVPLVRLDDDTWVLELSHGPTGAFKDFGARFLARALACWAPPERAGRTILVATSGDTAEPWPTPSTASREHGWSCSFRPTG